MRGIWKRVLGLSLSLAVGRAYAEEPPWRPVLAVTPGAGQSTDGVFPPPRAMLGRPVPITTSSPPPAALAVASLARPVPLSIGGEAPAGGPAVLDRQVQPAAFNGWFTPMPSPFARGQSSEALPMPLGPAVSGLEGPAAPANRSPEESVSKMPTPLRPVPAGSVPDGGLFPPDLPAACRDETCEDEPVLDCGDACPVDCCCGLGRLWVRGEYLLWGIKNSNVPPLVTTSAPAMLGVLGPGTNVLVGGAIDNEARSGGRFTVGFWFDRAQTCGVEGSWFFLGQRTVNFAAGSSGIPLLARPFFNVNPGVNAEDAELIANPLLAGQPGQPPVLPLAGGVAVGLSSRLWGTELNGLFNLVERERCRLDLLGGFRYVELDERLAINESLLVPADSPMFAGTSFFLTDGFSTRNQFYGGQVGLRAKFTCGLWDLELLGKVALGASHETTDIGGVTLITPAGGAPSVFAGGLLTQPTNIGRFSRNDFAVVPEAGINIGYQLTPRVRLLAGYTFLFWSNVMRPGDQVDRVVNSTQLTGGALVGPARPAPLLRTSDFWAQGLNLGIELRF
jgi:hypothetical protein